jgi:predicted ATPase
MDSKKASAKKIKGHNDETFFERYNLKVQKGNDKTDLRLNGKSYASLKGGVKIQWGMHVINKLPERFQKLFSKWISTYGKNSLYLKERTEYANEIVNLLSNKETRKDLINYFFRKDENVPFLIVKDVKNGIYYRINYLDLINVLVDNLEFYITKDKVKINARIDIGEKQKRSFFDIEPRSDNNYPILMHGLSERVIKVIKYYNINVKETYKQDAD